jgi:signal transduction histidine kinase
MISRNRWTDPWISHLLVGLLYGSVVLRAVLTYRESAVLLPAIVLLGLWGVLFVAEPVIHARGAGVFHFYLALQSALTFYLLTRPELPSFEFFALLFAPLSMQLVPRSRLGLSLTWLGLFAILMMAPLLRKYGVGEAIGFTLIFTAVNLLLGFYALDVGRLRAASARNQTLAFELAAANRKLEETSAQLEQLAAVRERHRLARELHDSVTQTVFSMTLASQSALLMLDRKEDQVGAQLQHLTHLSQDALSQMHELISELKPEPVPALGLAAALRQQIAQRSLPEDLCVAIEVEGDVSLRPQEEHALLSIAREAVNNIVKHARASRAVIRLSLLEPPVMEVEDDGRGFDARAGQTRAGVGIAGMRERATEIGWELQLISSPGAGTRLRVTKLPDEARQP